MKNEGVFVHGVALANFRGIGDETAYIAPFQRFNFMIGPNNAGKSTVLSFLANYLKPIVTAPSHIPENRKRLGLLDKRQGAIIGVQMGVGVPVATVREMVLATASQLRELPLAIRTLDAILTALKGHSSQIWVERLIGNEDVQFMDGNSHIDKIRQCVPSNEWNVLYKILTRNQHGNLDGYWIPSTLSFILQSIDLSLPRVSLIPAIRQISAQGQEFKDWSGAGLIEELARLQNPGVHERECLEKFARINDFLKTVTENATAQIEIPYTREHVLVHMDNKVLPLESLGTGIHEVVMLAAFCTLMESEIVCIEEPELHLHPLLQRRLIKYLIEKTDNQYFIATHSPSLIDTPGAAVFHVSNRDGQTQISPAISSSTRFEICRDLGYRASDLLQTNAIVWVEGPSDRIYIRHWISLIAPDLIEGTDYSIMFYGGRLLSHLTADDQDIAEDDIKALIAVRQLNRNLAVVIDSDRSRVDAEINATKARVLAELATHGGIGWLTAGREIENYVPSQIMTKALEEAYPLRFGKRLKSGRYDHVLPFKDVDGVTLKEVDKVKVARKVCERMNELDTFDLKGQILSLVGMIRASGVKLEK